MKNIIEIDRLVVKLASFVHQHREVDLYPVSQESTIFLACEQSPEGTPQWTIVAAMDWWYSAFGCMCRERATLAEARQLLVNGAPLKAEAYVKLWRQAGEQALTLEQMVDKGFVLVATISVPTAYLKAVQHGSVDCPRILPYLRSPNIVSADGVETLWRIELDGLESLKEYAALMRVYADKEDYPGEYTPKGFALQVRGATPDCVAQTDLFSEVA